MSVFVWIRGPRRQWGFHIPGGKPLFSERYGYRKAWRALGMRLCCQAALPALQPRFMIGASIGRWARVWQTPHHEDSSR